MCPPHAVGLHLVAALSRLCVASPFPQPHRPLQDPQTRHTPPGSQVFSVPAAWNASPASICASGPHLVTAYLPVSLGLTSNYLLSFSSFKAFYSNITYIEGPKS